MKITNAIIYTDAEIKTKRIIPEELGGVNNSLLTEVICSMDNEDIYGNKSFDKLRRYVAFRLMAEQARLEYSASLI